MCNGSVGNYSLEGTVLCQYQVLFSSTLGTGLMPSYHIPSFPQYNTGCGLYCAKSWYVWYHDMCVCVLPNGSNVFLC